MNKNINMNKNKKIIVVIDIQNPEEFEDISIFANRFLPSNAKLIYVGTKVLQNGLDKKLKGKIQYSFINTYSYLPSFLIDFFRLIYLFLFIRADIHLTGSPALSHRLAHLFCLYRVKHLIYYRALLTDTNEINSRSLYVKKVIFKDRLNSIRLINNFLCDGIVVSGNHNKNVLINYGVPKDNIYVNNFVNRFHKKHLDSVRCQDGKGYGLEDVVFIVTAFYAHFLHTQHADQLRFIGEILNVVHQKGTRLILKLHPRDNFDYGNYFLEYVEKDILILESCTPNVFFLKLNLGQTIISPVSTLAFELLYYGYSVRFYSVGSMDHVYGDYFDKYLIPFCSDVEDCFALKFEPDIYKSFIESFYSSSEEPIELFSNYE